MWAAPLAGLRTGGARVGALQLAAGVRAGQLARLFAQRLARAFTARLAALMAAEQRAVADSLAWLVDKAIALR